MDVSFHEFSIMIPGDFDLSESEDAMEAVFIDLNDDASVYSIDASMNGADNFSFLIGAEGVTYEYLWHSVTNVLDRHLGDRFILI